MRREKKTKIEVFCIFAKGRRELVLLLLLLLSESIKGSDVRASVHISSSNHACRNFLYVEIKKKRKREIQKKYIIFLMSLASIISVSFQPI